MYGPPCVVDEPSVTVHASTPRGRPLGNTAMGRSPTRTARPLLACSASMKSTTSWRTWLSGSPTFGQSGPVTTVITAAIHRSVNRSISIGCRSPTKSTTSYNSVPFVLSPAALAIHSALAAACPSSVDAMTTRTEWPTLPAVSTSSPGLYSTDTNVAPPPPTATGCDSMARMASGEPPPRPRWAIWWRARNWESVSPARPSTASSGFA